MVIGGSAISCDRLSSAPATAGDIKNSPCQKRPKSIFIPDKPLKTLIAFIAMQHQFRYLAAKTGKVLLNFVIFRP